MSRLILSNSSVTMTSLEIADLVEKRHDHVVRDLRVLSDQGVIDLPRFGEIYKDTMNRDQTIYRLPKRETLILTSGYSAPQRAAIIDRWLELESSTTASLPSTYIEALKALVASEEAKEAALLQIEADKPYVEVARLITGATTMVRRDWLALMKEDSNVTIKERALTDFLIDKGYVYRDQLSRELRAYAHHDHLFKLEIEVINGAPRRLLKVTGDGVLLLTPIVVQHFSNAQP